MNELTIGQHSREANHRKLLSSASALALIAYVASAASAQAEDTDRPSVWIEFGGQFEQIATTQEVFAPDFFTPQPSFTNFTPGLVQKPLDFSFGAEGKITFQPEGTNWVFSAGVRYGRSNGNKHIHQSTPAGPGRKYVNNQFVGTLGQRIPEFVDATAKRNQDYDVLDFQAGKDVGLGVFGNDSHSVLSLGVRFAQFGSSLRGTFGLDPDNGGYTTFTTGSLTVKRPGFNAHDFMAEFTGTRSFHGEGPSFSWNGSAPVAGNPEGAEVVVDWGVNASLLFGRQKSSTHHQTTAYSHPGGSEQPYLVYRHTPPDSVRSRSVVIPNIGGLAGLSLKFPNAKVSLGYRADFFFGAMDGGIDTHHSETVGFHGPFATVSIGLGG